MSDGAARGSRGVGSCLHAGPDGAVTVYRMIAAHTIEESILRIHEKKRDLVDRILEGQEQAENLDVDAMIQLIRDQALA